MERPALYITRGDPWSCGVCEELHDLRTSLYLLLTPRLRAGAKFASSSIALPATNPTLEGGGQIRIIVTTSHMFHWVFIMYL